MIEREEENGEGELIQGQLQTLCSTQSTTLEQMASTKRYSNKPLLMHGFYLNIPTHWQTFLLPAYYQNEPTNWHTFFTTWLLLKDTITLANLFSCLGTTKRFSIAQCWYLLLWLSSKNVGNFWRQNQHIFEWLS